MHARWAAHSGWVPASSFVLLLGETLALQVACGTSSGWLQLLHSKPCRAAAAHSRWVNGACEPLLQMGVKRGWRLQLLQSDADGGRRAVMHCICHPLLPSCMHLISAFCQRGVLRLDSMGNRQSTTCILHLRWCAISQPRSLATTLWCLWGCVRLQVCNGYVVC